MASQKVKARLPSLPRQSSKTSGRSREPLPKSGRLIASARILLLVGKSRKPGFCVIHGGERGLVTFWAAAAVTIWLKNLVIERQIVRLDRCGVTILNAKRK